MLGDSVSGVDPEGLWTFGFSFNFGWGGGIGGTTGLNFVVDGHGNFQIQWINGTGGYAGQGYGASVDIEISNADNICDLLGNGYQHGADGGEGIAFEGGAFGGKGYSGYYGGIGVGGGLTPAGYSVYATHTTPIWGF